MWNKPRVVPPPPRKPVVVPPPVKFKAAEPVPWYLDSVTSTQRPKPELVPGYFDFVTGLQVSSPRMRFPKPELVPVYFDSVTGLQISPPGSSEPSTSTRCPKPSCSPSMKLFQKWEAEKTAKMQELVVPETLCHEDSSSEFEEIQEEVVDDGKDKGRVAGRRSRKNRWKRTNKQSWKRKYRKSYYNDDKKKLYKIDIRELRYSQLSCKPTFQCGRSIAGLVQDLLDQKVSLSASFLRLTVFETLDETTNEMTLRCIDNRRLFALNEYSRKIRKPVKVHVSFYSYDTVKQFERFQQNSDKTSGKDVRLRNGGKKKPWRR